MAITEIKNEMILQKLEEKTIGDKVMRDFILMLFARESQGKHYMDFYRKEIKAAVYKKDLEVR